MTGADVPPVARAAGPRRPAPRPPLRPRWPVARMPPEAVGRARAARAGSVALGTIHAPPTSASRATAPRSGDRQNRKPLTPDHHPHAPHPHPHPHPHPQR
ncbi:hypothetical protein GCM10018793_53780 [Streptomyces sulfonofaciens]|uniref:Uncharacterized protein n=1 Tax=Streptomyces sulfonofaciens TaxID=68272 RepID=A0A919GK35_9ACTN|nr:hypothetical protein GCM10018793_53780 [Streptomyces sulfonofaciens]